MIPENSADEEIRTPDRPRANRLAFSHRLKADALLCPLCQLEMTTLPHLLSG